MHIRILKISFYVLLVAMVSACASTSVKPDLTRLYNTSADSPEQPPVVFIHGFFGSRLRNTITKEEVWPGSLRNVLFGGQRQLAVEINSESLEPVPDTLEPYALFNKLAGKDYYGPIIDTLTGPGGYIRTDPGTPPENISRRLYVFLYDWRLDIASNAARLAEFIDRIQHDFDDPQRKVDIVAHSMGALVARYFIRFGNHDVLDADVSKVPGYGVDKVRKVVMLGPPNSGSISGLQHFMMGYRLGLRNVLPDIFATMPGAYQLLPHPDRDWMIDVHGKRFDRSLYDASAWKKFGWGIYNQEIREKISSDFESDEEAEQYLSTLERFFEKQLRRAKRFYRALSLHFDAKGIQYIVFGGDCELTPARCLVEEVNGNLLTRLHPTEVVNRQPGIDYNQLMLEPGDGTVTKLSALARSSLDMSLLKEQIGDFPLSYSIFLCENHVDLPNNISFQDNLLNILLVQKTTADRLAEESR